MANVLAMCGSLRKGSFNRQLMNASIGLAPAGMTIKEAPSFAKFPLYNFDDQQATGFQRKSTHSTTRSRPPTAC
jgi:chromate reductase